MFIAALHTTTFGREFPTDLQYQAGPTDVQIPPKCPVTISNLGITPEFYLYIFCKFTMHWAFSFFPHSIGIFIHFVALRALWQCNVLYNSYMAKPIPTLSFPKPKIQLVLCHYIDYPNFVTGRRIISIYLFQFVIFSTQLCSIGVVYVWL